MFKQENGSHQKGKFRQYLVTIIVNMLPLTGGITLGWSSPTIPQLVSDEPPVGDTPFSKDQIAWINSLVSIGGFVITPFCGILVERLGRKKFAIVSALPQIIAWLLVIFAQNHLYLYAARFAGGVGIAMCLLVGPLYISEIASEDIRGSLTSLVTFFKNIGVLFAYVVGSFASFRQFGCLALIFPLSFVFIFACMPETPAYLVNHDRSLQAYKSLMFLRGNNETIVEQELDKLRSQGRTTKNISALTKINDFLGDQATRRGLIICFGLIGGQQLSGIFAMLSYAETLFKYSGTSNSASTASMFIAAIQIIGSYAATMMMESAGRRRLALISCFGMTISHFAIGLFFYLQHSNFDMTSISWLPIVALSTYVISYVLGMGSVPFVVISEVFRQDVSSFASTLCCIVYWIMSFVSIHTFDMVTRYFGVDSGFFMLASFCAFIFVFTYCLVPETKGRSRQDIVNELAGDNCRQKKIGNRNKRDEMKSSYDHDSLME